jgi:hypothetical protein
MFLRKLMCRESSASTSQTDYGSSSSSNSNIHIKSFKLFDCNKENIVPKK